MTKFHSASRGVTLVTNMVINAFVPPSVTLVKMVVTSSKRMGLGVFSQIRNLRMSFSCAGAAAEEERHTRHR